MNDKMSRFPYFRRQQGAAVIEFAIVVPITPVYAGSNGSPNNTSLSQQFSQCRGQLLLNFNLDSERWIDLRV